MTEFILSIVVALGSFESNDNDLAKGGAGERSRYQITRTAWYEHTHLSFHRASDPKVSGPVCQSIVTEIIQKHKAKTPYQIYCYYNGGTGKRSIPVVRERARRFEKLWKEQQGVTPSVSK